MLLHICFTECNRIHAVIHLYCKPLFRHLHRILFHQHLKEFGLTPLFESKLTCHFREGNGPSNSTLLPQVVKKVHKWKRRVPSLPLLIIIFIEKLVELLLVQGVHHILRRVDVFPRQILNELPWFDPVDCGFYGWLNQHTRHVWEDYVQVQGNIPLLPLHVAAHLRHFLYRLYFVVLDFGKWKNKYELQDQENDC